MTANNGQLKRHFGYWTLLIYGVGDILGAGIYALVGKVAGVSGAYLWLSFALAMVVAVLTGLSYAELAGRYPRSGGAAYFCSRAFNPVVGYFAGWILFCATIVSMATLSRAFVGYLESYELPLGASPVILLFVGAVGLINFRGIKQSSAANMIATTIEVSGLLIVLATAAYFFSMNGFALPSARLDLNGVFAGAALAFYAFIGFEDIANVAEETKNPERVVPRTIISAVIVAGALYMLVAISAAAVAGPERLAASNAPLVEAVRLAGAGFPLWIFPMIALFAIFNTTLLNYVTSSRLLYGMAREDMIPALFGRVHARFKTPFFAIALIFPVVIGVASLGNLQFLASAASGLILAAFSLVNLALIRVHRRGERHSGFRAPTFTPYLSLALNVAAFFYLDPRSLALAALLIGAGAVVFGVMRLSGHTPGPAARAD